MRVGTVRGLSVCKVSENNRYIEFTSRIFRNFALKTTMEKTTKSKYYLFIDECGDHNLAKYDPGFPAFTLCGILVSRQNLNALNRAFEDLKEDVFGTKDVVIHSVDIRKWRGPFSILADESVRVRFFEGIERILSQHEAYVIVSCTILKEQLNKFCVSGEEDDVYGLSLSYLIERSIVCVDNNNNDGPPEISVVVERRGKKEDNKLLTITMVYVIVEQNGLKPTDCGQESETLGLRIRRTISSDCR